LLIFNLKNGGRKYFNGLRQQYKNTCFASIKLCIQKPMKAVASYRSTKYSSLKPIKYNFSRARVMAV
jgi:hypothetical protein